MKTAEAGYHLGSHISMPIGENECNSMCDPPSSSFLSPPTEELNWWDTQMCKWNGKSTLKTEINLIIDSDVSLMGWGACCQLQTTGGPWSQEEAKIHINCLELLETTLAVKSFVKDKSRISIPLRINNTTAVAYINHLGGTQLCY